MAENFEQLEIWQIARDLAVEVYRVTHRFPKTEVYSLCDQIKRSVTSVSANIAEGTGRYFYKDKRVFMYNARGSLYETRSHLLVAEKLFSINRQSLEPIYQQITTLSVKLNNFIRSMTPQ